MSSNSGDLPTATLTTDSGESRHVIEDPVPSTAGHTTIAMNAGQDMRGASFAGASFNFTKGMLGAGILGLPHAVRHCGFGVACIMGAFLLIVCYMSMVFIVRVCYFHTHTFQHKHKKGMPNKNNST